MTEGNSTTAVSAIKTGGVSLVFIVLLFASLPSYRMWRRLSPPGGKMWRFRDTITPGRIQWISEEG